MLNKLRGSNNLIYLFKDAIMKVKWSQLALKTIVWLSAEFYLTVLGIDNLADYGEFLQYQELTQMAEMPNTLCSTV